MTGMFVEEFPRLKAELELAYREREAAEREQARLEVEARREQVRCSTLEEELERERAEREQAVRRVSELTAVVAKVPLVEAARDAAETRANQLAGKLETAKGLLAEAAEREKTLSATVAERDVELDRLTVELDASAAIVSAARARVEADRAIVAELGKL